MTGQLSSATSRVLQTSLGRYPKKKKH